MSSIPPTASSGNSIAAAATSASKDQLSMDNFMHLLTVQLANQDPLNPMNDRDFFAQMAQLGQVQGMDDLKKSMQVTQAQSLMGQTVTATRPNGDGSNGTSTVTGVVSQLTIQNGNYMLGVQDINGGGLVQVNISAIQSVAPKGSITDYQNLIGKDVTGTAMVTTNGTASAQFVEGIVSRVFAENGQTYARVHRTTGADVDMATGDIRSIAPAS